MNFNLNRLKSKVKRNREVYKILKLLYLPISYLKNENARKDKDQIYNSYRCIKQLTEKFNMKISFDAQSIVICVSDGRQFYFDLEKNNSLLGISTSGDFESVESNLISNILSEGDVVFDIGANFGWYSSLFAKAVGDSGKVHSFEPIKDTYKELELNIELNCSNTRLVLNNCALGEKECELTMYVPEKFGSAWASRSNHGHKKFTEHRCRMITLDGYAKENSINKIKFIKCDVEGAELFVLNGAKEILASENAPIWLLEVEEKMCKDFGYRPYQVFKVMTSYGYSAYRLNDGRLILMKSFDYLQTYNFIFLKSKEHFTIFEKLLG